MSSCEMLPAVERRLAEATTCKLSRAFKPSTDSSSSLTLPQSDLASLAEDKPRTRGLCGGGEPGRDTYRE